MWGQSDAGCGGAWLLRGLVLVWLAVLADVDRRTGRIPNRGVLPLCGLTVLAACWHPGIAAGATAMTVPYLAAHGRGAVGGGDAKLAVPAGGLLADPVSALIAVTAAALLSLVGCLLTVRRTVRHGPPMIAAVTALTALSAIPPS